MQLTSTEFRLLKTCVSHAVPLLVCAIAYPGWFLCPNCDSVLDREYMANCTCCGQKLSWHGTMKSAYSSSAGNPSEKHSFNDDVQEKAKELEADINLLKEQIKDKTATLKQLMEIQEEKKREEMQQAHKSQRNRHQSTA